MPKDKNTERYSSPKPNEVTDRIGIGYIIRPLDKPDTEWLVVEMNEDVEDVSHVEVTLLPLKLTEGLKFHKVLEPHVVTLNAIFNSYPVFIRYATDAEKVLYGSQ